MRRNHVLDKIIGDKYLEDMPRKKLKNDTYLLCEF